MIKKDNLYFSEGLAGKEKRILSCIKKKKDLPGLYLITLSKSPKDNLDIINTIYLSQIFYKKKDHLPSIIGVAKDHKEALELVCDLALECYRATGDVKLKEYLKESR